MIIPLMENGSAYRYLKKFGFKDSARFLTVVSMDQPACWFGALNISLFRFLVPLGAFTTSIHNDRLSYMEICTVYAHTFS